MRCESNHSRVCRQSPLDQRHYSAYRSGRLCCALPGLLLFYGLVVTVPYLSEAPWCGGVVTTATHGFKKAICSKIVRRIEIGFKDELTILIIKSRWDRVCSTESLGVDGGFECCL